MLAEPERKRSRAAGGDGQAMPCSDALPGMTYWGPITKDMQVPGNYRTVLQLQLPRTWSSSISSAATSPSSTSKTPADSSWSCLRRKRSCSRRFSVVEGLRSGTTPKEAKTLPPQPAQALYRMYRRRMEYAYRKEGHDQAAV
uniref:(northern house mosquito) hypothetical protein n=2 Tax=Culex pipiens TaxID=7175 RepID=A0A8D8EVT5_CULPI